jgi:hypothetical protein
LQQLFAKRKTPRDELGVLGEGDHRACIAQTSARKCHSAISKGTDTLNIAEYYDLCQSVVIWIGYSLRLSGPKSETEVESCPVSIRFCQYSDCKVIGGGL